MLYFDYKPKDKTESELEVMSRELFENSTFQIGDIVRVKGDVNSPNMIVSRIELKNNTILYEKLNRRYIEVVCQWFNKGRQEFVSTSLPSMTLTKVVTNELESDNNGSFTSETESKLEKFIDAYIKDNLKIGIKNYYDYDSESISIGLFLKGDSFHHASLSLPTNKND